ncbi:MAG: DUF465 domain-containing protein [Humidesulfovibrio sp.]|nr:DUF465 domain-containing protein [Humidesulfovibrio sp.]
MEGKDRTLLETLASQDSGLRALWQQHLDYEKMIVKLEGKPFLSPVVEQEIKELKKKKLAGKTKLQALLDKYRQQEA